MSALYKIDPEHSSAQFVVRDKHYQYELNLRDIAEVLRRGRVARLRLLELGAAALVEEAALAKFAGRVSDSGEGRWTLNAAIDEGVPRR